MAEQTFRLPGSSYEELKKIILAFAHAKGKASNTEVSRLAGIDATTISRNTRFLIESGIVDRGQKKQITAKGGQLARALEHQIEAEVRAAWLSIFEDASFFETIVSAVRIRGGMDANTLKSHIAYTAGQPKNKYVMTGAQSVIDILKAAGRLAEEEDKLVPTGGPASVARPIESEGSSFVAAAPSHLAPATISEAGVTIQIQIQCTPDDLDGLGAKLRKVMEELSKQEAQGDD